MAHILAVDDDPDLCTLLKTALERDGHAVEIRTSGVTVTESLCRWADCILLDVMMPGEDGFATCRRIRAITQAPILFLTARTDEQSVLTGLGIGADDYLTKPFNILELKARIRALLRRAGRTEEKAAGNSLTIGTITLDLDARNAYRNGQLADLTAKEFDVIEFLMRNPNRVYSREALLDTIWAYEYRSDIRTVDVHIRRLREKLEENPAEPKYILTKWGVGYYFRK